MRHVPGDLADAVRLAVGTLTVVPVPPPRRVDRDVAGTAMALAPVVGAALAVPGAALLWLLATPALEVPPALAATLAVGLLAALTRGLHLDGLADTADGLGAGRHADPLAVMKRGDVGPFGVATLVLVLLVQALSLGALVADGAGAAGLVTATTVSRLVLPVLCLRGVPAARGDGLGRSVAGSVDPRRLVAAAAVGIALLAVPVLLLAGAGVAPGRSVAVVAGATVVAGAAAAVLAGRAVRRFGGITGDVLGAAVEVSFTATLLALVLAP